jgi:DNA (cytosine-5)-methyltransferase 1
MYMIATHDPSTNDFFEDFVAQPLRPLSEFLEKQEVPQKYYYTESSKIWPALAQTVTEQNVVYQYRRTMVRQNKSGVCPTLTANMGTGGHNVPIIRVGNGIRKLTPRECFNLQGFGEDYAFADLSDAKLYKLAGNAVSLPVVKEIARRIVNVFFCN